MIPRARTYAHVDPKPMHRAERPVIRSPSDAAYAPARAVPPLFPDQMFAEPEPSAAASNRQFQPEPQRYVGSYVMGPDGHRVFIANP
jgi:hypothetical protein